MKKFILFLLAMFLAVPAFASVGVRLNGAPVGTAADINFVCGSRTTYSLSDGSVANIGCDSNLASAGVANGGATSMTTTDSTVPVGYAYVRKAIASLASGGAQTGTLAAGIPGQVMTIFITSVGASGTFTVTPSLATGWSTIKFTAAKDIASFLYVNDTLGWIILSYTGTITVTQP